MEESRNQKQWKGSLTIQSHGLGGVGERIKFLRMYRNYSLREIAEKIGRSHALLHKWERSELSPRTVDIVKLSEVLKVPVGMFFAKEWELKARD